MFCLLLKQIFDFHCVVLTLFWSDFICKLYLLFQSVCQLETPRWYIVFNFLLGNQPCVAVEGPVTVLHLIICPGLFGQGDIPLAEWLVRMSCHQAVWGSKPTRALCALTHLEWSLSVTSGNHLSPL